MRYFKNVRHKILITLDDNNRRSVLNNGITFVAPDWYQPAFEPIEEISEDEFRYIVDTDEWETKAPTRNDTSMYLDWD